MDLPADSWSRQFGPEDLVVIRRLIVEHPVVRQLDRARRQDFILAVDELVANAIRHGGGHGRLALWSTAGQLWFQISDDGPGMASTAPRERPAPTDTGGRGLWLARHIVADMSVQTSTAGTIVTGRIAL